MRGRSDGRAHAGRHARQVSRAPRRPGRRLAQAFPALLGPSRRAVHRRYVVRRVTGGGLVFAGYALALTVDLAAVVPG